ncbi:MAG: acetate/propionate family kinase [Candidatus Xenobia bacterium]
MNVLALMVGPYGPAEGLSVAFRLLDMEGEATLAFGAEPVGESSAEKVVRLVIKRLLDSGLRIEAVGHRVTHGGERFTEPCYVTDRVLQDIRQNSRLAPLSNPHNLAGIEEALRLLPEVPHIAVFSTSFHQGMPDYAYIYGIPYDFYLKYGVRRYGFQGLSHQYVCQRAAQMLKRPLEQLRIISCHLGHGVSVAAVRKGRSIDTSMGFTPLEGVPMSTRAGDLDAAMVPYLMDREGLSVKAIDAVLNRQSGLLGISGISSSMLDLLEEMRQGSYRARLAVQSFCYRLKKYVSAYFGVLGGADAVVFTAGMGENAPLIRSLSLEGLECLGIQVDPTLNHALQGEGDVSAPDSKVRVLVIPTREELMLARAVVRLLSAVPQEQETL